MSKSSRDKKVPVVKLPRNIKAKIKAKPVLCDSSDDDDFLSKPLSILGKLKKGASGTSSVIPSEASDSENDSGNTVKSKYFQKFQRDEKPKVKSTLETRAPKSVEEKTIKNKVKTKQALPAVEEENVPETKTNDASVPPGDENTEPGDSEKVADADSKVVCPFCWKRLSDKLTGTTHIKTCAKNLPTNQIFEALQLQEKQIKEWEELGIQYPAFVGGVKKPGNSTTGNTKAPRIRKKKQDPDLELAIALSVSLHEEVERRQTEENAVIIENGLEDEIGLKYNANTKPLTTKESSKIQVSNGAVVETTNVNMNKRRGKKVNVMNLPLFKATDAEKKKVIEQRFSRILDENEHQDPENQFNIRVPIRVDSLKSSSRLDAYINKNSKLWSIAGSDSAEKNDFVTEAIKDCKERNENENPPIEKIVQPTSKEVSSVQQEPTCSRVKVKSIKSSNAQSDLEQITISNPSTKFHKAALSSQMRSLGSQAISQGNRAPLSEVAQDLLNLFVSAEDYDVTLYGREEKPIRCHKIILRARCPKLLAEMAVETTASGRNRPIIPLTCYSHVAVKAFAKFVYCGRLSSQIKGQDLEDVQEMSEKYELSLKCDSANNTLMKRITKDAEVQTENSESSSMSTSLAVTSTSKLKTECDGTRSIAVSRGSLDLFEKWSQQDESDQEEKEGNCNQIYATNNDLKASSGDDVQIDKNEDNAITTVEFQIENEASNKEWTEQNEEDNRSSSPIESTNISSENQDGSRDLFEDEFEDEIDQQQSKEPLRVFEAHEDCEELYVSQKNRIQIPDVSSQKNPDPQEQDFGNGILEDELCSPVGTQILLSPKPYSKRSRSLSPKCFRSSEGYTATQMADYLELKELGMVPPESPDSHQAKKKHKLDLENSNVVLEKDGNVDDDNSITIVESVECSLSQKTCLASSKFLQLRKDSFGTFESIKNAKASKTAKSCNNSTPPNSNTPLPETSLPNISAFSPWSTPAPVSNASNSPLGPIMLQNPNFVSPILPEQNADFNDPFADDMDDSCFANLPSILLQASSNVSITQNIDKPQNTSTPLSFPANPTTPVRNPRQTSSIMQGRLSQKNIVFSGDRDNNSETLHKNNPSKRGRKKVVPNVSLSQGEIPKTNNVIRNPLNRDPVGGPSANNVQPQNTNTSLLNYSTIDTPILKKELKRYGLKPLPRSKAKVILRHIYSETHK